MDGMEVVRTYLKNEEIFEMFIFRDLFGVLARHGSSYHASGHSRYVGTWKANASSTTSVAPLANLHFYGIPEKYSV